MSLPQGMEESPRSCDDQMTVVHFVETSPSVLREMPWITLKEHKVSLPSCLPLSATLQLMLLYHRMQGQR